jgi:hypothetical protein
VAALYPSSPDTGFPYPAEEGRETEKSASRSVISGKGTIKFDRDGPRPAREANDWHEN